MPGSLPCLAVLPDFPEEGWPSMDVCAEMLLRELGKGSVCGQRLCPPFRRRFGRMPVLSKRPFAFNADRFLNRHYDYPRHLRKHAGEFDFFHIVDHSYAHLVLDLPLGRTGVFCHDLDTFRCLLEPKREPRPAWFRRMARRKLDGLQQAVVVFHSTELSRRQIEKYQLIDPARLIQAPYGVCPEFVPEAQLGEEKTGVKSPFLLHVGSCIERKRIDVLLDTFAEVTKRHSDLRLVQVGGNWTTAHRERINRIGIGTAVVQLRGLPRSEVAALYRQAAGVLLPSEAEGFGLPLIEALACGSIVVASDLPVLREVGGPAAIYLPVGDVAGWAHQIETLLDRPELAPSKELRRLQAAKFSWADHARVIAEAYLRLGR